MLYKFAAFLLLAFFCLQPAGAQQNLIKNPGFEETSRSNSLPAGGWWTYERHGSASVAVDSNVAHSGHASLRVDGGVDARFSVVSPQFEVAPGDELHFQVWARAKDLPTNQSITAGLAFRRKDGTVFQQAAFHLDKPGGEWRLIAGDARAPTNAVSVEVHLNYTNGPGTVWFDDVVAQITNPYSVSLFDGPKLSFVRLSGAQDSTDVQLVTVKVTNRAKKRFHGSIACAVGGHTSSAVVIIPANESRTYRLPVPNEIGRHRYKLSLLDDTKKQVHTIEGKFVIAAPLVMFPACPCFRIAGQSDGATRVDARVNVDPDARKGMKIRFELSDSTGRAIQQTNVDASNGEFIGCSLKVPVSQAGIFNITASLLGGRNGKALASDSTEVHVTADDHAKVTIDPKGFLRVDGSTEFPIGIYNCGRFDEMGKAGFNASHEYGIVTGPAEAPINPNERRVQELLDRSWANGLRAMIELPRSAVEKGQWDQVRRRIETFKHHPGLLCWGSEERVARGTTSLDNIAKLYQIVHEIDPDHPLVLGDTRDVVKNLQTDRRNFFPDANMDVGIWWWYPFPLKEPDGNGLKGATNVCKLLEPPSWLTTTLSKKPLWIAIQAYQRPWKGDQFPTPAEYRAQAYLSIINGVKGLFFYVGYGEKNYEGEPAGLLNQPEESHWDYVQKLAAELREFTPVITSPAASDEVKLSPTDAPVEFTTRQSRDKAFLIAANKSYKTQQVRFESALFKGHHPRLLYEEHTAVLEGDTLTDEFQPLAVHIYEFTAK